MFFDFIVDDLKFLLYNWIANKKRGKTMNFKERKQLEEVLLKNILEYIFLTSAIVGIVQWLLTEIYFRKNLNNPTINNLPNNTN